MGECKELNDLPTCWSDDVRGTTNGSIRRVDGPAMAFIDLQREVGGLGGVEASAT